MISRINLEIVTDALEFAFNASESKWVCDQKITPAIAICEAALAEPSEPEPLRDDEVGDIARGMNIEITLNNEDTLLDFARAIESAVWERGFEMSIEYAQGWDDAKAQVTTDNSAALANALKEIERLKEVINLQVENYAELKEQYEAQGGYFNSVMVENDKAKKDAKLIDRKDAALRQVLTILEEEYVMPDEIETAITTIKAAL